MKTANLKRAIQQADDLILQARAATQAREHERAAHLRLQLDQIYCGLAAETAGKQLSPAQIEFLFSGMQGQIRGENRCA